MVDLVALGSQVILHLQDPLSRMIQIPLIQQAHQAQILFRFASRLIEQAASVQSQQFTLSPHTESAVRIDHVSQRL